jgi:hypothetical protein
MSEPQLRREVRRPLAITQHAEEVTGNVASNPAFDTRTACRRSNELATAWASDKMSKWTWKNLKKKMVTGAR